jgi:hypothetical protein
MGFQTKNDILQNRNRAARIDFFFITLCKEETVLITKAKGAGPLVDEY